MEATSALFDVPLLRVEEISASQAPWSEASATENLQLENKYVNIGETKHSKVKERKRYSQKLAKQLQGIGVDVDIVSGVENKQTDVEEDPDGEVKGEEKKEMLKNIANETNDALGVSYPNGMDGDKDDCQLLSEWDPMKDSYESKSFNSYQKQNYNDNFMERHTPIKGSDGKVKISPTKVASEDVRLFISNIPLSLTEDGLLSMFSSVGKCRDVKKNRVQEGHDSAIGFVTYTSVKEAEAAICKYNNFAFDESSEQKLRVKLARQKEPASYEKLHWGENKNKSDGEKWDSPTKKSPRRSPKKTGGYRSGSDASGKEEELVEKWKNADTIVKKGGEVNIEPRKMEPKKIEKTSYVPLTRMCELEHVVSPQHTRMPEQVHGGKKPRLYLQGLPVGTTEKDLQELLDHIGPTSYWSVVPPKKRNQRTTYGFVTFECMEDAEKAINFLDDSEYRRSTLKVAFSEETVKTQGLKRDDDESFYDKLYDDISYRSSGLHTG